MRPNFQLAFSLPLVIALGGWPSDAAGEEFNPFKLLEPAELQRREADGSAISRPASLKYAELRDEFDRVMADRKSGSTRSADCIDLVEELILHAPSAEERNRWVRQYVDDVTNAAPKLRADRGDRLAEVEKLALTHNEPALAASAAFGHARLKLGLALSQGPSSKIEQALAAYQVDLQAFVKAYPKSTETAEAMYDLSVLCALADKLEDAQYWRDRLVRDLPNSDYAKRFRSASREAPAAP